MMFFWIKLSVSDGISPKLFVVSRIGLEDCWIWIPSITDLQFEFSTRHKSVLECGRFRSGLCLSSYAVWFSFISFAEDDGSRAVPSYLFMYPDDYPYVQCFIH